MLETPERAQRGDARCDDLRVRLDIRLRESGRAEAVGDLRGRQLPEPISYPPRIGERNAFDDALHPRPEAVVVDVENGQKERAAVHPEIDVGRRDLFDEARLLI